VSACQDLDLLLPLHASGALEPADAARVEAHLSECAACRLELEGDREVLSLAKLPPVTAAERRAITMAPRRALAEFTRADGRRARWARVSAGIAVAAAAVVAILTPVLLRRTPEVPVVAAEWEAPDPDAVWEWTEALELDGGTSPSADEEDAALAALEL
jgi:predicted anti-sigma-YlaC factor YlaD